MPIDETAPAGVLQISRWRMGGPARGRHVDMATAAGTREGRSVPKGRFRGFAAPVSGRDASTVPAFADCGAPFEWTRP